MMDAAKISIFKINPSKVTPTDTDKTTVTTAINKDIAGVSIKEANNKDAAAYADAIGITVNGTNGAAKTKDTIISNATKDNDYKVEYSFVQANGSTAGSNVVGDYVAAKITLKKDGNFALPEGTTSTATGAISTYPKLGKEDTGVKYAVTEATAKDNGVITLYVPIVEKSISDLDISLDQTSYTFTGTTIEPK